MQDRIPIKISQLFDYHTLPSHPPSNPQPVSWRKTTPSAQSYDRYLRLMTRHKRTRDQVVKNVSLEVLWMDVLQLHARLFLFCVSSSFPNCTQSNFSFTRKKKLFRFRLGTFIENSTFEWIMKPAEATLFRFLDFVTGTFRRNLDSSTARKKEKFSLPLFSSLDMIMACHSGFGFHSETPVHHHCFGSVMRLWLQDKDFHSLTNLRSLVAVVSEKLFPLSVWRSKKKTSSLFSLQPDFCGQRRNIRPLPHSLTGISVEKIQLDLAM